MKRKTETLEQPKINTRLLINVLIAAIMLCGGIVALMELLK